ncbi:MAG: gamma-glutamyltransferase, partial [Stackebrandtia sp.]
VDADGTGVSLIQSNAGGFGSGIFEPSTGIGLQNRGIGFSLTPGHPAEYAPGRRPPHTLAPAVVTYPDGRLRMVLGTMGGDAQPQILLQILLRMLRHGASPGEAIAAPRWRVASTHGFDTWTRHGASVVDLEAGTPAAWDGLASRGHDVTRADAVFGHAHLVEIDGDGMRCGAADARAEVGGVCGR